MPCAPSREFIPIFQGCKLQPFYLEPLAGSVTADPMGACYAINPPKMFLSTEIMGLIHAPKADFQPLPSRHGSLLLGMIGRSVYQGKEEEEKEEALQAAPNLLVSQRISLPCSCGLHFQPLHVELPKMPGFHSAPCRGVSFPCFHRGCANRERAPLSCVPVSTVSPHWPRSGIPAALPGASSLEK